MIFKTKRHTPKIMAVPGPENSWSHGDRETEGYRVSLRRKI